MSEDFRLDAGMVQLEGPMYRHYEAPAGESFDLILRGSALRDDDAIRIVE